MQPPQLNRDRRPIPPARECAPPSRFVSRLVLLLLLVVGAACARLRGGPSEVPLRVMSFNIAYGHGDLEGIAKAIRASAPDVVALQEVDVHWDRRSGFADQALELAKRLQLQVRFAPIYRLPGASASAAPREFGVALLSRHPISAFRNHTLARLSTLPGASSVPSPLPGFLEATIEVGGKEVRVFNTHTDYRPDPRVRQQQVAEMLAYIGKATKPTLLLGDLNAPPNAPELQPLLKALRDVWPGSAGLGFTYPATNPVRRIDYVLTSEHFRVKRAWVPPTVASDHRPVVADLALRK